MAKKKANRAAGLAALAGLAYMASRGKEGKTAPDRDDADTYMGSRAPRKSDEDFNISGEGGFNAPADMSMAPRSGTPAPSVRTATSSPAPAVTTPSARKVSPDGAFRSIRSDMVNVGGGRSAGRGGPEAGEEAAYRAKAVKKTGTGSGGGRGPAIGEEAAYRASRAKAEKQALVDSAFEAPSEENIQQGLEMGVGGASLRALNAAAKNLANRGKSYMTKEGVKEIGYEPLKLGMKKGGAVKKMASGGMTSSTSKRGDGIASKGKTRCKMY